MTSLLRLFNDLAFLGEIRDDYYGRRGMRGCRQDPDDQSDNIADILQYHHHMAEYHRGLSAKHLLAVFQVVSRCDLVRHVAWERLFDMLHGGLSAVA